MMGPSIGKIRMYNEESHLDTWIYNNQRAVQAGEGSEEVCHTIYHIKLKILAGEMETPKLKEDITGLA